MQTRSKKQPPTKSDPDAKQSYMTTRYGLSLQGEHQAGKEDTYALVVQFDDSYMKQSQCLTVQQDFVGDVRQVAKTADTLELRIQQNKEPYVGSPKLDPTAVCVLSLVIPMRETVELPIEWLSSAPSTKKLVVQGKEYALSFNASKPELALSNGSETVSLAYNSSGVAPMQFSSDQQFITVGK